jgi:uncharacterized protein
MVVSMIQFILELPGVTSLKEKRRIVKSLKDKMHLRFKITAAEVDLQESLSFTQMAGAVVSNSKQHGESVLNRVLQMVENESVGRIQDVQIISEFY